MKRFILIFTFILIAQPVFTQEYDDIEMLYYLLKKAKNPPVEKYAKFKIYRKKDLLYCEGDNPAGIANNEAVKLMEEENYIEAIKKFKLSLKMAPLFFPYHYNLGIAYYFNQQYKWSALHLKKAKLIVPEYYMVYIQLGHLKTIKGNHEEAILDYRKSLRLNPKYIECYIFVGNGYLSINRVQMAQKYFDAALKINPFYNNAILGKATILFQQRKYFKAYQNLKYIDTTKPFDASYHYYFAECAYRLEKYDEAFKNYTILLEMKNERFFLKISRSLIENKRDLAEKFAKRLKEDS